MRQLTGWQIVICVALLVSPFWASASNLKDGTELLATAAGIVSATLFARTQGKKAEDDE